MEKVLNPSCFGVKECMLGICFKILEKKLKISGGERKHEL